jgi:glucose-1-phosphate thymidylyltransferase
VDAESRIEGKVVIEPGAPSSVGHPRAGHHRRGARIVHAYVGPVHLDHERRRDPDSEIEHSIVLEGSCMRDLANRVIDSLIGKNVRIYRMPVKPSAYRFMLGDNSEVGIRW